MSNATLDEDALAKAKFNRKGTPRAVPVSNATLDKDNLTTAPGNAQMTISEIHISLRWNGRSASQRSQNERYLRDAEKMPNLKHAPIPVECITHETQFKIRKDLPGGYL